MPRRVEISRPTSKVVWGRAGGHCSLCFCKLIEESEEGQPYPTGILAHINGERPGAARYDSSMTEEQRSSADNIILICPTHHEKIDKDEEKYTVEMLKEAKKTHEEKVLAAFKGNINRIGFKELRATINYLATSGISELGEMNVVPLGEKIRINSLSNEVATLIIMGLAQQSAVSEYLKVVPGLDFPERLKKGFVEKYQELKAISETPDQLFYELLSFSSCNSSDFTLQTAGLVVLSYFFESCDVFEHVTAKQA